MWSDDDRVTKIDKLDEGFYPKRCPVCGKNSIHLLMYKPETKSSTGGCWIWCSACKRYSHASITIPEWWSNCNELEESQLFASPEQNIDEKREEIDKWVNLLISEKADVPEQIPKNADEDKTYYVVKIEPQIVQSEGKAELVEQICQCNRDEAKKLIEREGYKLHPTSAIDTGIIRRALKAKGISFTITPDYKWD